METITLQAYHTSVMGKPSFTLIGAGNVATHFGLAIRQAGCCIRQVYSRTIQSAEALASQLAAQPITSLTDLRDNADVYIVAISDEHIPSLIPQICHGRGQKLFVHTAGSVDTHVFREHVRRYGVIYPLQTLSRQRHISMQQVPLFIDANNEEDMQLLTETAHNMGAVKVMQADSSQRLNLHLAAVFASNFTNHCYALAHTLLQQHGIPFDMLLPLIGETAAKVGELQPSAAQTGPARRADHATIGKHLAQLEYQPRLKRVYKLMSESIMTSSDTKTQGRNINAPSPCPLRDSTQDT